MLIPDAELAEIKRLHEAMDAVLDAAYAAGTKAETDALRPFIDAIDDLVGPYARAAAQGSDEDLRYLASVLPSGFYRLEMRTLLNRRAAQAGEAGGKAGGEMGPQPTPPRA